MRDLWSQFGFALTFLTRIPLPGKIEYDSGLPARALFFYPLVGIILGGFLAIIDYLLGYILSPAIRSLLVLAVLIYLTGGLHLDGFMDMIDGFYSGRKREQILEIMHDSRVGAFGVIGLVLLFLLKFNLLRELSLFRVPVLLLFPVISRWLVVVVVGNYPVIAGSKLGKDVKQQVGIREQLAVIWPLILLITLHLTGLMSLSYSLSLALVAVIFTFLFVRRVLAVIGGMTGDIYGALIEMTEVVILLMTVILIGII